MTRRRSLAMCENFFSSNSPVEFGLSLHDTAIVGSSGKLLNENFGEEIDSRMDVVRFNRAPTERFEKSVGSITTLRVLNNVVFNNNPIEPGWPEGDSNFTLSLHESKVLYFAPDYAPLMNWKNNIPRDNHLYYFLYNRVEELKAFLGLTKNPSVGMGLIGLAIMTGVKPFLYGFDTEPGGERTFYYGNRPPVGPCHDTEQEKVILKALHDEGKLVIR